MNKKAKEVFWVREHIKKKSFERREPGNCHERRHNRPIVAEDELCGCLPEPLRGCDEGWLPVGKPWPE